MYLHVLYIIFVFFFKQKTAYKVRISDWSSDVCSSDLHIADLSGPAHMHRAMAIAGEEAGHVLHRDSRIGGIAVANPVKRLDQQGAASPPCRILPLLRRKTAGRTDDHRRPRPDSPQHQRWPRQRSEEPTSELQSLMRISYAVFCL